MTDEQKSTIRAIIEMIETTNAPRNITDFIIVLMNEYDFDREKVKEIDDFIDIEYNRIDKAIEDEGR